VNEDAGKNGCDATQGTISEFSWRKLKDIKPLSSINLGITIFKELHP
jgi:hypothetical protein